MHMTVIAGKEVVKQYYSTPAKKSYYLSCSNGAFAIVLSGSIRDVPSNTSVHLPRPHGRWKTRVRYRWNRRARPELILVSQVEGGSRVP